MCSVNFSKAKPVDISSLARLSSLPPAPHYPEPEREEPTQDSVVPKKHIALPTNKKNANSLAEIKAPAQINETSVIEYAKDLEADEAEKLAEFLYALAHQKKYRERALQLLEEGSSYVINPVLKQVCLVVSREEARFIVLLDSIENLELAQNDKKIHLNFEVMDLSKLSDILNEWAYSIMENYIVPIEDLMSLHGLSEQNDNEEDVDGGQE